MNVKGSLDLDVLGLLDGGTRDGFAAAKARLLAYFADECTRNLDRLLAHFTDDAEVVTPDGVYRGRDAVAAVYRKSFDTYPGLTVEVKAGFAGRGAHCFEYRAVLSDTDNRDWLIEGINLMKLESGLISSLRSFEDAPRPLSVAGSSR
jgi:hypothetical protein